MSLLSAPLLALFQHLNAGAKLSRQFLTDPLDSHTTVVVVQASEITHFNKFAAVFPSKPSIRLPPGPQLPDAEQRREMEAVHSLHVKM